MTINLLPEGVWSRIAAGEVLERPSSAVKEMIENSLDAGAKRIRVKLWDGGRVRIVVEDDGAGIAFDELPLALTRHATSKIAGIEDLDAIHTLGYRGEALASMAAVAKVEIRSRPPEEESGGLLRAFEGRVSDHLKTSCSPGTRVQVDELFSNLPARRKFLKSAAGELRRVASLLREYAICRPDTAFVLEHDGRSIFSTDGSGDRRRVIEYLWGAEPAVLTVEASAGHIALECWWQPRQGRNDVISFVNGRAVNDPLIKGAVGAAARELIGGWALFFTVDPALVDVNIHPAKAEIRFRYPGEVFSAVKEASLQLGGRAPVYVREGKTLSTESRDLRPKDSGVWKNPSEKTRPGSGWDFKETNSAFTGSSGKNAALRSPSSENLFGRVEVPGFNFGPNAAEEEATNLPVRDRAFFDDPTLNVPTSNTYDEDAEAAVSELPENVTCLGQLASGYLIFDTPGGAVFVDPHAAHERVAFERIRAEAKDGQRSQPLLMPVPLPPSLQLEAEEKEELLKNFGFALEKRDGGLWIAAIPSLLKVNVPPEALLRGSLAALRDGGDADPAELLWRNWATMACKEAVKVTTELGPEEALTLWRDLHECQQPFFCPHGRPTILELSNAEFLRHFGRE
ncbi:MAG: DNA mismatch repair endonuclease MutL [Synergistaceae bacterium]|jgi:DNA mismatch repair protein MutL|nr:DNA mismatch repair endonuclease MutL [Synergistaceae bacterium]